jgi:hypothetical protein
MYHELHYKRDYSFCHSGVRFILFCLRVTCWGVSNSVFGIYVAVRTHDINLNSVFF